MYGAWSDWQLVYGQVGINKALCGFRNFFESECCASRQKRKNRLDVCGSVLLVV